MKWRSGLRLGLVLVMVLGWVGVGVGVGVGLRLPGRTHIPSLTFKRFPGRRVRD